MHATTSPMSHIQVGGRPRAEYIQLVQDEAVGDQAHLLSPREAGEAHAPAPADEL